MTRKLVFDIEADNLLMDATQVWCLVVQDLDTGEQHSFPKDYIKLGLDLLDEAELLIGHNIIGYDLPVLKRLFNYEFKGQIFDTLLVSRLIQPDLEGGHSLKAWGQRLGNYKGDFNNFSEYSQEMLDYCRQDVKVTGLLTKKLFADIQESGPGIKQALKLEHEFARIIALQVTCGFTLDVEKCEDLYQKLETESIDLTSTIGAILPKIKHIAHYNEVKKNNLLVAEDSISYSYITQKTKKLTTKEFRYDTPNPTSRQQLIKYFQSKGWVAEAFTDKGNAKMSFDILSGMPYEEAKLIARLLRLQKQMGMLKSDSGGWLNHVRKDTGRVHGSVLTLGTNTGRCTHSQPNLAQSDAKDTRMRELWIPKAGWELVGCDASSLELRILGHYLHRYDEGAFAFEVVNGDIHTYNQHAMGLNERKNAKTAIYGLLYGAGNKKLGEVAVKDLNLFTTDENELSVQGKRVRESVIENLTGYKDLSDNVISAYKSRGYLLGLDGRHLFVRAYHDGRNAGKPKYHTALNLLIQSAGAIIMKQALINFYNLAIKRGYEHGVDYNLLANIHDEVQLECRPDIAYQLRLLFIASIGQTKIDFKLNVNMWGDGKIGNSWAETH